MKAVILNPGPSLANLDAVPECDLSIAVNRAALKFPCTIWAAADYPMIRDNWKQVLGQPRILTIDQTWHDIGHRVALDLETTREEIFKTYLNTKDVNWPMCTSFMAVVCAARAGATEIEIYGADWEGTEDFDGTQAAGEDRTEQRWEGERATFIPLCEVLKKKGVEVRRIQGVIA